MICHHSCSYSTLLKGSWHRLKWHLSWMCGLRTCIPGKLNDVLPAWRRAFTLQVFWKVEKKVRIRGYEFIMKAMRSWGTEIATHSHSSLFIQRTVSRSVFRLFDDSENLCDEFIIQITIYWRNSCGKALVQAARLASQTVSKYRLLRRCYSIRNSLSLESQWRPHKIEKICRWRPTGVFSAKW